MQFLVGVIKKVEELLIDHRVNFLAPADYSSGKELDGLVKRILDRMSVVDDLYERHRAQEKTIAGK